MQTTEESDEISSGLSHPLASSEWLAVKRSYSFCLTWEQGPAPIWLFWERVQKLQQFFKHVKKSRWGPDCFWVSTKFHFGLVLPDGLWVFVSAVVPIQIMFHTTSQQSVLMGPTAWHEKASLPPATPLLPLSHDTDHNVSFPEEVQDPGVGADF